jgi:hypothetical protein
MLAEKTMFWLLTRAFADRSGARYTSRSLEASKKMLVKNHSKYWNLSQVSAWVVFRSLDIVENFTNPKEHGWQSFAQYASLWPTPKDCEDPDLLDKPIPEEEKDRLRQRAAIYDQMRQDAADSLHTLQGALIRGRIIATGRLDSANSKREVISTDEWDTLIFEPPSAYRRDANRKKLYPWVDIRIEQKAVMEIWPIEGGMKPLKLKRGSKNWGAVDRKISALRKNSSINLATSDRELSERLRRMLAAEHNASEIPGDRAMRGHISELRQNGILPPRS